MLAIQELNDVLKVLFFEELGKLIKRYTTVTQEEQGNINEVMAIVERLEIQAKYSDNLEKLLQLSSLLKDYSVQVVEFYLWCMYKLGKSITIEEADEYIMKIEESGYVEIDGILVYEEGACLDEYIEKLLRNELLTDTYHIKRLIDIDEIIEMWLEGTPISEVEKELKHCDLNELLDDPVQEGYITYNNKLIMYIEIEL